MMFHVPPRNGGQIVEVAYAAQDGMVIRRTYDRSDLTTVYHVSRMLRDDECEYWEISPRNRRWRLMTLDEVLSYALV